MYTIYLFFQDVKAAIDTRDLHLIEAMRFVIKRQNWSHDDLRIFRDRVREFLTWIEEILEND